MCSRPPTHEQDFSKVSIAIVENAAGFALQWDGISSEIRLQKGNLCEKR